MNKVERNIAVDKAYDLFKKSMNELKESSIDGIKEFLEECKEQMFNLKQNGIDIAIDIVEKYDDDILSVKGYLVLINSDDELVVCDEKLNEYHEHDLSADVWYELYCDIYFYYWKKEVFS